MAKVLLGFMGAGKSTLAQLLDPNFVDMDTLLTEKIGMPISDFFATEGEPAFRALESQLLAELLATDCLVATGGGVVTSPENRALLTQNACNIYLKADFDNLYQRIAADQAHQRPLFLTKTKAELRALFEERIAWYEELATQVVEVADRSPEEIREDIG